MYNIMPYAITRSVLGCRDFVPITEHVYEKIKVANTGLLEALYLEEKLDLVLGNFFDFEMVLLHIATENMIFLNPSYRRHKEKFNKINRHIINLLSGCRLYLDHSVHHLKIISNEAPRTIEIVKRNISSEYDSNLGYRLMYELRNYVQHRGFPFSGGTFNANWIKAPAGDKLV